MRQVAEGPDMPVVPQTVDAIVEALDARGLGLRRLGLEQVADDDGLSELWTRAIRRTGRTLPLEVGLELPPGAMGVVDYLAASSASVGAAFRVVQEVFPLVAPEVQLQLDRLRTGAWRIRIIDQPPFPGEQESDLFVVGAFLGRIRRLASRPLELPLVELREAPDPAWARLVGTRVRCRSAVTAAHLSPADWAVPLRSADGRLQAMLRRMVGAPHRTQDALLVALRALARDALPAPLTLDRAAPTLGLSRRTLQRRLAQRRTSLSDVYDAARRERAEELMAEGVWTIGEVAFKVGFAERASFTRAWRRWFGVPPRGRGAPG